MSTYTTNYNLEKPDSTDDFKDFRSNYNSNMDIIDANLGGGGGSSTLAGLTDVSITTPVTGDALIYDGAEWANTPLADVATSGDYTDLINTPTIPTALSDLTDDSTHRVVTDTQISTWNGKSDFSGSYNDLTDKPTIPTVNDGTLTIQQNGTTIGTFTANQSGNTIVNLTGGGGVSDVEVNGSSVVNNGVAQITDIDNVNQTSSFTVGDNDNDLRGEIKIQNGLNALPATATIRTNISQISDLTFQLPSQSGTLALQSQNIDYLSVVNGAVNITYYTL